MKLTFIILSFTSSHCFGVNINPLINTLTGKEVLPPHDVIAYCLFSNYTQNPCYESIESHIYEAIDGTTTPPVTESETFPNDRAYLSLAKSLYLEEASTKEKVIGMHTISPGSSLVCYKNWNYYPINWEKHIFEKSKWLISDAEEIDLTVLNFTSYGPSTYFLMEVRSDQIIDHFLANESMLQNLLDLS